MTHEEMCEAIQRVVELLDGALDGVPLELNDGKPYRRIGTIQGLLANVLAALEAEQPLAEGLSQLYRYAQVGEAVVRLDSLWFRDKDLGLKEGEYRTVRVIILPAKEEAADA